MSMYRTCFFALDASGKSAARCHHRGCRKARTGKSAAGFFILQQCYPQKSFKLSNLFHRIFRSLLTVQKTFDTSGKSPAHYHYRENHAEARAEKSAAGFFVEVYKSGLALCNAISPANCYKSNWFGDGWSSLGVGKSDGANYADFCWLGRELTGDALIAAAVRDSPRIEGPVRCASAKVRNRRVIFGQR
jgi:hypothetical protein